MERTSSPTLVLISSWYSYQTLSMERTRSKTLVLMSSWYSYIVGTHIRLYQWKEHVHEPWYSCLVWWDEHDVCWVAPDFRYCDTWRFRPVRDRSVFPQETPPGKRTKNIFIFTGRNEVTAKVIFLHLSVIHSVHRGGSASVHAGIPHPTLPEQTPPRSRHPPGADPPGADTPQEQTPPCSRHPPWSRSPQTRHPPCSRHPPEQTPPRPDTPLPWSRLQHTVYDRPVRILLECILVINATGISPAQWLTRTEFEWDLYWDRDKLVYIIFTLQT